MNDMKELKELLGKIHQKHPCCSVVIYRDESGSIRDSCQKSIPDQSWLSLQTMFSVLRNFAKECDPPKDKPLQDLIDKMELLIAETKKALKKE